MCIDLVVCRQCLYCVSSDGFSALQYGIMVYIHGIIYIYDTGFAGMVKAATANKLHVLSSVKVKHKI